MDTQKHPLQGHHDRHRKTTRRRKKHGFTFIELTVVMVIIGILSSQTVPLIADSWDKFLLRRIAAKVLVIISLARQHAIADERATLVQFSHDSWCVDYQDEAEGTCTLGYGTLPSRFYFNENTGYQFSFYYSAGRGFSPLSAGRARLYSQRGRNDLQFINSSVGRIRLCSAQPFPGIALC